MTVDDFLTGEFMEGSEEGEEEGEEEVRSVSFALLHG